MYLKEKLMRRLLKNGKRLRLMKEQPMIKRLKLTLKKLNLK